MSGHENKVMCFMEVEWDERPKKERQFGYLNMRGRRRRRGCSEFRVRSNATYTQTETETVTEREDGGGRCSEF